MKHATREHSRISPSGLKSLQQCPGYESDSTENEASKRGTFLHEIIETGEVDRVLDPEDRQIARDVLNALSSMEMNSPFEPLKEVELDYRSLKISNFEKGHADRVIVLESDAKDNPVAAALVDFKFGKMEVDHPSKNIQFRAYALGLFLMMETLERVVVRLIQPALNLDITAEFTRDRDFEMIVTQIRAIVKRREAWLSSQDSKMLKPDSDLCGWCSFQATCPAWQAYMVKMAKDADLFGHDIIPLSKLSSPDSADPDEVLRAFRWIKPMQDYLKKFKQFALAVYDSGRLDSGVKLIEKPGDSSIVDPIRVAEILKEECGVTLEEFIALCDPSITKIKERISSQATYGQKSAEVDRIFRLFHEEGLIQHGNLVRYLQLSRSKKES